MVCLINISWLLIPSNEISREAFHVKPPGVFVGRSADLHAVSAGCEAGFDDAVAIDETLPCQCIDLQSVSHVRIQKLENRMHCAQLPMCRKYKWFQASMCT